MEKMNVQQLESFLSENVKTGSRKVWRSNIKKIITLQDENTQIEFLNDLISLGKSDPRFSHLQDSTWHTIEKNTNSFLSHIEKNQTVQDEPLTLVVDEPVISSIGVKDEIANLNALSKIQAEEHAKTQKEILENQKRLRAIQEEEKKKEAQRKSQALKNKIDKIFEGFESEDIPANVGSMSDKDIEQYLATEAPEYYQQYSEMDDVELSFDCNQSVILSGVSGSGKTELLRYLGWKARQQDPDKKAYVLKLSCGQDTKAKQLLDSLGMDLEQRVKRMLGVVAKGCVIANKTGKVVIVILDEINLLTPKTQKVLNSILDGTRFLDTDLGRIQKNKGTKLFLTGTMNANYSGTNQLNVEFKDRFNEVITYKPTRETLDKIFSKFEIAQDEKNSIIKIYEELDKAQMQFKVTEKARYTIRSMISTMEKLEMLEIKGVAKKERLTRAVNMSLVNKFNDQQDNERVKEIVEGILN